ncbi:MAG TPA: DUF6610 family protein [Xanthobacteraceae bacterium]|nr:DUF6610 family protein [Xanthobacteraceae bacterium]
MTANRILTNVLAQSSRSRSLSIRRFVNHSFRVANIARKHGWLPGARYTNLRDIRQFERLGFLDIDWKNYSFTRHLNAARSTRPILTVARDIENIDDLCRTLDEAHELSRYADEVIIVPKDPRLRECLDEAIPSGFLLGFSVPTRYGGTVIPTTAFRRPVHLLGGRPDVQRRLASVLPVVSIDCNRFTLDASFGDYFDGDCFRPHPKGGYDRCLEASIRNINKLWLDYDISRHWGGRDEAQRHARKDHRNLLGGSLR